MGIAGLAWNFMNDKERKLIGTIWRRSWNKKETIVIVSVRLQRIWSVRKGKWENKLCPVLLFNNGTIKETYAPYGCWYNGTSGYKKLK